jgi:hypothetical protein
LVTRPCRQSPSHHESWCALVRPRTGGQRDDFAVYSTGRLAAPYSVFNKTDPTTSVRHRIAGQPLASWGATRLANGSGTFSYDISATQATCTSTWQTNQRIGTAARPSGIALERFSIYGENLLMRVQWFIEIRTN